MKTTLKILILLIVLIGSMYYWINADRGIERIVSMLGLVIISYLLGRAHQNKINGTSLQ